MTLIILIILAAVTIRAVYETKIVEYAVNGARDYSEESIKENEILDNTANLLDSVVESIKDKNKHEEGGEEEIDNTITEEDIGKYVAYVVPTSDNTFTSKAEYSGYTTDVDYAPTEGLKWRILRKEGNKVELISEIGDNNKFYMQGYQGYNNAVALLNNACNKMYVNKELGAVSGRNLKIEDIEEHYTGERATEAETTITSNNKYYPSIFGQEEAGNIDDKGYGTLGRSQMPRSGLNSEGYIEQTSPKQANVLKGKETYYTITITAENMNKDGGDGSLYASLFKHRTNEYHWIASRCVYFYSHIAHLYVFRIYANTVSSDFLYSSNDSVNTPSYAVRPVVTIDLASVKLEGEGTAESPYTITKR